MLELLVVLVIAMLALAVVTPRFAALLPGVELKNYSQQTAALLRMARSRAISQGEEVELVFDGEAKKTWISGAGRGYSWPDNIQLQLTTDYPQRTLPKQARIIFYPDGGASGGLLTVSSTSRQYRIEVNWLTGSINVHE